MFSRTGFGLYLSFFVSRLAAGQISVTSYAPNTNVQCPDASLLRLFTPSNQSLHPSETEYIASRQKGPLLDAWEDFLGDGSTIGYNTSFFSAQYPNIGIALSGGGYRAAQYGAGVLSALDVRNDSAKAAGTGGLLQVSSYISGLSGGSWLLSSLYFNDFPTIPDLVLGNGKDLSGWLLDLSLFLPDGIDVFDNDNQHFFGSIMTSVLAKAATGIDTSLTDPWSRALSYHFLNQTSRSNFFSNDSAHGAGQLWSQIPDSDSYRQFNLPLPLVVMNSRPIGSNATGLLSQDATVYEVSPYEFASFDPSLSAGANMTFLGTNLLNGKPANGTSCVTKFDEVGFIMGTSSNLFNSFLDDERTSLFNATDFKAVKFLLARLLQEVRTRADDVANWPNPFNGITPSTFQDANSSWLELIDGGSNGEVIPIAPLLVKSRELDVIVAVDASSDDNNNWPNGESLLFTANRTSRLLQSTHKQFPPIPATTNDLVSQGLNQRPAFFGCDPQQHPPEYPLIIYLPNSPPLNGDDPVANTETLTLVYTLKHTRLFLDQAHANTVGGFKPNTNSPDPNWGKCLQCAAIDRARLNANISRSDICTQCFKQYCFDPNNLSSNSELPNRKVTFVDPDPQGIDKAKSFIKKHKALVIGLSIAGGVLFLGLLGACWVLFRKRRTVYNKLSSVHH